MCVWIHVGKADCCIVMTKTVWVSCVCQLIGQTGKPNVTVMLTVNLCLSPVKWFVSYVREVKDVITEFLIWNQ